MPFIVIELFPNAHAAHILVDSDGVNVVCATNVEATQLAVEECQKGLVVEI